MAETTGIEWCDSTFNPWIGCEKVSPGCAHCYAETLVTGRMGRAGTWGADGVRQRTSEANWQKPLAWERKADAFFAEHGRRRRVFCASLADVFEPRPELEGWRAELFTLIAETPSLDWLILTKRPEQAAAYMAEPWWSLNEPLANIWLGTSIENARHTYRADVLREVPAAVRFISAEPLLGSLYPKYELSPLIAEREPHWGRAEKARRERHEALDLNGIDWLIVGGESGPEHRPMNPLWARELRDACEDNGVAFFFKQWGGRYAKAGGKILDGREWCEFPRQAVAA